MKRIGFIGLGSIGAPMARCIVRAGYQIVVCDKRPKSLVIFKEMGAIVTEKVSDCADREVVIVMVADDAQVREVVLGSDGLLNAVDQNRPPMLAVMSTVLPETIHKLAPKCAEKKVRLVDAPVSGFPTLAEQGKLSIMVGGEKVDVDAMRPVFEVMGENIYHTGALGSGDVTKIVNNIIGITNMFLSVEAMLIGQKCGMEPFKLAPILETSSGRNFATKDWEKGRAVFKIFSQSIDLTKVLVDLSLKDLKHAQKLAKGANVECPLLDYIIQALSNFSYEEIKERWHSVL